MFIFLSFQWNSEKYLSSSFNFNAVTCRWCCLFHWGFANFAELPANLNPLTLVFLYQHQICVTSSHSDAGITTRLYSHILKPWVASELLWIPKQWTWISKHTKSVLSTDGTWHCTLWGGVKVVVSVWNVGVACALLLYILNILVNFIR